MGLYDWTEQLDFQKFAMPFKIRRDVDYFPNLKNLLLAFVSDIEAHGAANKIVAAINDYTQKIIASRK